MALESFNVACSYEPDWEPPQTKKQQLMKYLSDITELVKTCGKMKVKRLHNTVEVRGQI